MMIVRLMLIAAIPAVMLALAGCSREQSDWKAAQAADTIEAYGDFLKKHSDSAEATEARTRVEQLGEERDWQRASTSDTREAYAQFIALHPNSKWTQEARIRIENFALGPTPAPGVMSAVPVAPAPAAPPANVPEAGPPKAPVPTATRKPAPAPVKPAAATAQRTAKSGGAAVQLGAFNSEPVALEQWQKLAKKHAQLAALKPRTEAVVHGGKTLYRLRTTVADQAAALQLCAALQHDHDPCLVVSGKP